MNITHTELGDQHTKTTIELDRMELYYIMKRLINVCDPTTINESRELVNYSQETATFRQDLHITVKPFKTT